MASSQDPRGTKSSTGVDFVKTIHHDVYDYISPLNPANAVPGLSVFIAGSSRAIGRATALAYAEAGASRIAVGARSDLSSLTNEMRTKAKAANKPEPEILALAVDVTSEASVAAAAEVVRKQWGHLDVIIHNAGIMLSFHPIASDGLSAREWWGMHETNLFGMYLVARFFLPLLLAAPETSVRSFIALTSAGALRTTPGGSAYQTSKLAIIRFCEFIVAENPNVVAFSVHPGGVESGTSCNLPQGMKESILLDTAELSASTLLWLGGKRRTWLNGRYVSALWDMAELEAKREEIEDGELLKVRMVVE